MLLLPIALPGIIGRLALALLTAFKTINLEPGFSQIIVVGHATFCVVVGFNNVHRAFSPHLVESG